MGVSCPWCGAGVDDAPLTLEALLTAWQHDELEYAHRCEGDTADDCALTSACPTCARPFMVALQGNGLRGRVVRLLAVRTATDAKLLGGGDD
jgi:hypothetical protein